MFDLTIHLGDVIVAVGFLLGAWRIASAFRDDMRALKQTVYGSKEPPIEGLVDKVKRHDDILLGRIK